ncbi:hypothetical protein [Salinithrix halophila]|uniref:Repeat domain-containing protein n=1 Tax=Salinithrix halophila TaxID=1485204 RepID=A0ABV8JK10_9BACL
MKGSRGKTPLLITIALILTGCDGFSAPEKLMQPPQIESGQVDVQKAVTRNLPSGTQLALPSRPARAGAIRKVDLDEDGEKEVVAFYTDKSRILIGALLLKKRKPSGWVPVAKYEANGGTTFDYATFKDMNGDRIPEIIIGWGTPKSDGIKMMAVLSLTDGKLHELVKSEYTDLAVADLDQDRKCELVLFVHNHERLQSRAYLYTLQNRKLKQTDSLRLYGSTNGYEQILTGLAAKGKTGIFVTGIGDYTPYTELLIMDRGRLKSVFAGKNGKKPGIQTLNIVPSEDVNGDGIIEIALQKTPPKTEDLRLAEIPWITSWYQWDGKDGLDMVYQNYLDYKSEYQFDFPQDWLHKVTVRKLHRDTERRISFYPKKTPTKREFPLLTIHDCPRKDWDKKKDQLNPHNRSVLLHVGKKRVYWATFPSAKVRKYARRSPELNRLLVNPSQIRKQFRTVPF